MAQGGGRASKPSWTPPDLLDEYRVVRLLGRGSMGHVYLAEDTLLGRHVAVKFIAQRRPDDAARRRFLAEARALARLQHPNVVAIHRVGEVEGHPYLVTELVPGRPLSELPRPLPSERVSAIGLDLARGLAAAHRRGVLHRDVKPSNVIVEDGGAAKLIDFGLAVIAHDAEPPDHSVDEATSRGAHRTSGLEIAGTPIYMAPEVLEGEPATVRSDIYSLGAVLHELCASVAPRETLSPDADDVTWIAGGAEPIERRAPDIDPRLAAVIARCSERGPEGRFPSAEAVAAALAVLPTGPTPPVPAGNPYRGLASFEAEHRAFFFGRSAETRLVVERLRETAFAVVTGDSGVGKSSLCRAGVLPLALDGALGDRRNYRAVTVLPGKRPRASLLTALAATYGLDEGALSSEAAHEIARALRRALGAQDGALIFVDQAEELVTFADPEEARAFAETVARLHAASAGVRVLVAVRGDFFTRIAALPGLGDVLDHGLFVLRPLGREGVRAAITGPAAQQGVSFEPPSLVEALVDAAGGAAGGLPLLQFTLAELWEARRGSGPLTATLVDALGGLEGALARHAGSVIEGLSPGARASARRWLTSLVTAERTARRRTAAELALDSPTDRAALDALVSGRLLVAREIDGITTYELAHESLLQSWSQLARWLDESSEERRLLQELEDAVSFWERRGRPPEETWSAPELEAMRQRARHLGLVLPARFEAFLKEGERRQATLRRRARVRLGIGAVVAGALTLGSLAVAAELRRQKLAAEQQAEALRLARGDLGQIDLLLRPFDMQGGAQAPVNVAELPELTWRLYAVKSGDVHHPGAPLSTELVRVSPAAAPSGTERVDHVEAPGGMAFLRIDGRGRPGERCAPSWIRLQSLPGYAARSHDVSRLEIDFPTCAASAADTVVVPEGPFVYGGPGEPPTKFSDYVEPERTASLPSYSIDRTEVSNAAYRPFAALERLSGYPAPRYPTEGLLARSGAPDMPVTSLDATTAEAFCRYMGKRLPGDLEWTKAARGGLTVEGRPNPHPRRLFPWGTTPDDRCVNAEGEQDGSRWLAGVTSYPCGASPYGVLNLAGNAMEWISREGQTDRDSALRVVRGGGVTSPRALEHTTTVFRNAREGRYFDFSIGLRCVAGGDATWSE